MRRMLRRLPGSARLLSAALGSPGGSPPEAGELRHVVYLPTWLEWDVMQQRPQYLVEAFAEHGHPVSFVDARADAARVVDGVGIVPDLTNVPGSGVLLYIHHAPVASLIGQFSEAIVVYDVLDDLSIYRRSDRRDVQRTHEELMASADLVTVSSQVLADRHHHERPDLLLVPNGVDFKRFSRPTPLPPDLLVSDRPIIGYHGAIERWFDFELFEAAARARPDWEFVAVGPVGADVAAAADRMRRLPNVTLVGERPSHTMPGYVQAFDVEVIWRVVDEMTSAMSPLKVYESLAAGVPVVSTPLPHCVEEPTVRTAADASGITYAIEAALGDDDAARDGFRAAAANTDWEVRLAPVLEKLEAAGLLRAP